jgi:GTP cyclohydrolase I
MQKDKQLDVVDIVKCEKPKHPLKLGRVGVSDVDFPLCVEQQDGSSQKVHAQMDMFCSLLHNEKGINMSRYNEALMAWADKPLSGNNFKELLKKLRKRMKSDDVYVSAHFKYFMNKVTPVSKKLCVMAYPCKYIGILTKKRYDFILEVTVPVKLCCPCSKAMSLVDAEKGIGRGAHNQRTEITVQVRVINPPGPKLETLIKVVESCGSAEIFPLLKRLDEKFITETAYANPKFVEDAVREAAFKLQQLPDIRWLRVKVRSFESIHRHDALAYISRVKKGKEWRKSTESFY